MIKRQRRSSRHMMDVLRVKELERPTHRKPTMIELICIASAVAFGLGFVAYHYYNAPRGYQRDGEFHFGEESK